MTEIPARNLENSSRQHRSGDARPALAQPNSVPDPIPPTAGRKSARIAYFSMEMGLASEIPTYSGGLGVLAGDTLRSAADLGLQIAGVTLLYRKGYFRQRISVSGDQIELPAEWSPEDSLRRLPTKVSVTIEGREVTIGCWLFQVAGVDGHTVPVYLLDSDLEENSTSDRALTHHLYGGDNRYRLCQEAILGIAGQRILQRLGHDAIETYHMNEGHSSLLALSLLEHRLEGRSGHRATRGDLATVRAQCVFTTHTPVPAGHDRFHVHLVEQVLGRERTERLTENQLLDGDILNMTKLALECSRYVNGVARIHQKVSQKMFPQHTIHGVTNGVHAATWTAPSIQRMLDRHIPEWRRDNAYLRHASDIPTEDLSAAHLEAKRKLIDTVAARTGETLDEELFTIGFARRATPYKRAHLLFQNLDRLLWIARNVGRFQLVFGGKAHPHDGGGKQTIRRIHESAEVLKGSIKCVYVENYEMDLGLILTSGTDLWLNSPEKTREASGTSGMKAALNGVPSLSVLDGWWLEGHVEGVTGWSAAAYRRAPDDEASVAHALYDKLERVILPLFYNQPKSYARVRRSAIALNGSHFNTQRMVTQYAKSAYFTDSTRTP